MGKFKIQQSKREGKKGGYTIASSNTDQKKRKREVLKKKLYFAIVKEKGNS